MSSIDTVNDNNTINSEGSIKNVFKEKLGEFTSLDINKINISEFNTRCQFLDHLHVKTLMASIEKRGYIPKSAVWVNAVTDNGTKQGNIIQYRLVAGRHRYEACRRIELNEIPCQLYYNLTDEEECELDTIDNELDEHHKPINFLEVAEHYKYLKDIKGWSIRQIARAKNVSKSDVARKLNITELSNEVKQILKSVPPGGQLHEKYFRDICKLTSIPHQILVCKEIIGEQTDIDVGTSQFQDKKSEVNLKCTPPGKPMTQSDVELRVNQLLALELQGKISREAIPFLNDKAELEDLLSTSSDEHGNNSNGTGEPITGQVFFEDYYSVNDTSGIDTKNKYSKQSQKIPGSNKPVEKNQEEPKAEQLLFDIFATMSDDREEKGVRFGVKPLWIKHSGLVRELTSGAYLLLLELIEDDFRYKPKKNNFFFIKFDEQYANCIDFLSYVTGVKPVTLVKKILPELEKFVFFRKNDTLKFQIKWNRLFEVYKNNAHRIPFDDGGLKNIPQDYSGCIRPTPYHAIHIENGVIKKIEEDGQDISGNKEVNNSSADVSEEIKKEKIENKVNEPVKQSSEIKVKQVSKAGKEKSYSPIAVILRELGMAEDMINFCQNRYEDTENIIKYLKEMSPGEKEKIKNIPGYIYKLVRDGFTPPEGFETAQEVEERRERKKAAEEFGEKIMKKFEEGKIKYFSPKEGLKFPLSIIPNNIQFLYKKSNGMPLAGLFSEFMDEKFFTG